METQDNTIELIPALVAVDFSSEKLSIRLTSIDFEIICTNNWLMPKLESENDWSWEIGGRIATSFIQNKKPYYALAIAIGCPGTVDSSSGVISDSRNNHTFQGFHITDTIKRHIDTPVAVVDRTQAIFQGVIKQQYDNDTLFVSFENDFCISIANVSGLYFPVELFQFRESSTTCDIVIDKDNISKKLFEICDSLGIKEVLLYSEKELPLVHDVSNIMSEYDLEIDTILPNSVENVALEGLIDIAAITSFENQTIIFK
tara:strand:- start:1070 stop:1843 length:774 start_codon:yes stop_codon:yes gene_type:complete